MTTSWDSSDIETLDALLAKYRTWSRVSVALGMDRATIYRYRIGAASPATEPAVEGTRARISRALSAKVAKYTEKRGRPRNST